MNLKMDYRLKLRLKKILTNGAILGIAAVIIGGLVTTAILIGNASEKQYHDDNTFDVAEDGLLMIAADDPVNKTIHYSCLNKEKNKMMTVEDFESGNFTAYKMQYFNDGNKFLDADGNTLKDAELHSYFLGMAKQFDDMHNFIVYEAGNDYLFSYEPDYRPGPYNAFNLTFYNADTKSLSLIRNFLGKEVVKLKILSDLNEAF